MGKHTMQRIATAVALTAWACSGAVRPAAAQDRNGPYRMEIEADTGPLATYRHRGQVWVAAVPGAAYRIRVYNDSPRRVEAVVAVDGRDVVSGDRADWRRHRGYVIAPYDSIVISGFRTSWNQVAAFYFTSVSDAYSSRRGTPQDVGVIGVAIFPERSRRPRPVPLARQPWAAAKRRAAPPAAAGEAAASRSAACASCDGPQETGTGFGADTYEPARSTVFRRAQRRPVALLTIRYDSYDALVRRGIAPGCAPGCAPPHPFPAGPDQRFAPSPY